MVKNCDLSLENAAVFSRPRSQFFTIRTFQPANNIYIYIFVYMHNSFRFSTYHFCTISFTLHFNYAAFFIYQVSRPFGQCV